MKPRVVISPVQSWVPRERLGDHRVRDHGQDRAGRDRRDDRDRRVGGAVEGQAADQPGQAAGEGDAAPDAEHVARRCGRCASCPAELDSPSGRFEIAIAASTGTPTPPPPRSERPSTIDSGTPSSSAPTAIAVPLPAMSSSDICSSPSLLRRAAPRRFSATFAATYVAAPAEQPDQGGGQPAGALGLVDQVEGERGEEHPGAEGHHRGHDHARARAGTRRSAAPTTSVPPAARPHSPACRYTGTGRPPPAYPRAV